MHLVNYSVSLDSHSGFFYSELQVIVCIPARFDGSHGSLRFAYIHKNQY